MSESRWLDFSLPPIDLLNPKIDTSVEIDKEAMYQKATLIEEKLADFGVTGKGDMLFLTSGGSNLLRLQGALISDDERKRVTDFLRSQANPRPIR